MDLRYYDDPETGQPHIFGHGVTKGEVEQVMSGTGVDDRGSGDSRMKIGQTFAGRYLQVIYVLDDDRRGAFVITAYEPTSKSKKAFRRRKRRKGP